MPANSELVQMKTRESCVGDLSEGEQHPSSRFHEDISNSPLPYLPVRMVCNVEKLWEIDVIKARVNVKVYCSLLWRDDRLVEKAVHDTLGVEYYRFKEEVFGELDPHEIESWTKLGIWTPNLILDNTEDGVGDGEVEQVGIVAHESRPHILLYKSFTQTVCQTMDLHMFPYDQLALNLNFMLDDQECTKAFLVHHVAEHLLDCMDTFYSNFQGNDNYQVVAARMVPDISPEDWATLALKCGILVESERLEMAKAKAHGEFKFRTLDSKDGPLQFSQMELRIVISNSPEFYVTKFVFVSFLITVMEMTTFFLDPSDFADRSSVSLTLVLTAVAFQYSVNGFLPVLPYLTLIDYAMFSSFVLLTLAYFENFAVYSMQLSGNFSPDTLQIVDTLTFYAYLILTILTYLITWGVGKLSRRHFPSEYSELYWDTLENLQPAAVDRLKKKGHWKQLESQVCTDDMPGFL